MPFNLLLLPLLGGFIVATEMHYFRLKLARYDHQRLVFHASLLGLMLLAPSFLLMAIIRSHVPWIYQPFESTFAAVIGTQSRYAGEAILAFLLSFPFTKLINRWYPEDKAIVSAIVEHKNAFEMLCLRSLHGGYPAMLTMKNGAVYIGWIREISSPFESTHVPIIPIRSGYRRDDGSVVFTRNYLEVYDGLSRADGTLDKARFIRESARNTTVLPKQEIIVSTVYYQEYERLHTSSSL